MLEESLCQWNFKKHFFKFNKPSIEFSNWDFYIATWSHILIWLWSTLIQYTYFSLSESMLVGLIIITLNDEIMCTTRHFVNLTKLRYTSDSLNISKRGIIWHIVMNRGGDTTFVITLIMKLVKFLLFKKNWNSHNKLWHN